MDVPPKLRELFDRHKQKRTTPSLDEISNLLRSAVLSFKRVYIVMDALDECSECSYTRQMLLHEIQKIRPFVHLIVTSRPVPSIANAFSGSIALDLIAQNADIQQYCTARIQWEPQLARYIREDPALSSEMIRQIVQNSEGM